MMGGVSKPSISRPISSLIEKLKGPWMRVHAALLQPGRCGFEQGGEHRRIVLGLEKTELAHAVLVAFAPQPADLRGNAAHRPCHSVGEEELHLGMLEIGVLLRVQMFEALEIERRHPVRVIAVDREGNDREMP